jgi:hypothetical protein
MVKITYDIVLADIHEYFSSRFMEFCGQFDLSFFLAEPFWAEDLLNKVRAGDLHARVYIDFASDHREPDNLYFALAQEFKKLGTYMIDDPHRVEVASDKGMFHRVLLENGVLVPETVVVPRGELDGFQLTDEIKARVGVPFVVKPGWGSGRWGVNIDATSRDDLLRSAKEVSHSNSFLIQQKIVPKKLEGRTGWFRAFNVFEEVIVCWWDPQTGNYQLVSPREMVRFGLGPLTDMVRKIARLSGVNFFSTEIARTEDDRFLTIDYLNTGCDMHAKSFWPSGPPDEVVRHIAWEMVDHAMTVARDHRGPFDDELDVTDQEWEARQKFLPPAQGPGSGA